MSDEGDSTRGLAIVLALCRNERISDVVKAVVESEWLAEAKAEAWDEGHSAGWADRDDDATAGWTPSGEHESGAINPYRAASIETGETL